MSFSALVGPAAHRLSAPDGPGPIPAPARVYLAPGRLYASGEDVQVTTILGSCVSVCIWDAQAQVGGINHFLLPSGSPASPRFGESAVALLIGRVLELGAQRGRLAAKVFGGACVPLKLDDKVTGVIAIFGLLPQKGGIEELDRELFDLLATQAAFARYCTGLHAKVALEVARRW